jgi:hypothetical protein
MVQRVMGRERPSTTLDLYTRRTDNSSCILAALNDPDEVPDDEDPDGGPQPSTLRRDAMLRGMLREPADHEKRPGRILLTDPLTRPSSGGRYRD